MAAAPTGFAQGQAAGATPAQDSTPAAPSGAPLTITLQDALQRARMNDPQYRTAMTDLGLAREDRVQARSGLLPGVNYNSSFIYTQGTGTPGATKFIANNGVHEYISQ